MRHEATCPARLSVLLKELEGLPDRGQKQNRRTLRRDFLCGFREAAVYQSEVSRCTIRDMSALARTGLTLLALFLVSHVSGQVALYPLPDEPVVSYPAARTGGNYMHNYYLPPPGTGSPWWVSWSPDGTWLAFSLQGSLWKIRVGESVAYELVRGSEYLSSPEWSPDGRWIVYTAETDGKFIHLRLLNLETGQSHPLTTGEHLNLDPAWSPDGSRLAFVSTRPNGYFNIFVMEIQDGQPGPIIQLTRDHPYGKERLYFGNHDLHIQPTWSPDGREIIFVSNRDIPLGSGALWRMPAVPFGIDQARRIHKEETLYRARPHWSPDGKRILYSSHLGGQFNNLFVLPAGGGEPYKMTFGEWDSFHPRWSPDGEWIAFLSNQEGLPQLRLLKSWGGVEKKVEIRSLRWLEPMGQVQVRVVDAETDQTVGARVYASASDGKSYVPHGSYHRLGRLARHFFHTEGTVTLEVPPGELVLEVMRGFEYLPVRRTVQVVAGEVVPLRVQLRRIAHLRAQGWYSGSNHVHMNYGGNLHNTPENLIFMAEAEDLDVVGELIANKDNRILDYQYFTGGLHPLSSETRLLYFNEEYRPPFYGHISLINLTRHLISPFTTGYEGTAIESLYPSNTDIFRLAREQGALGAYVHPFAGNQDPLEGVLGVAKGFPVDVALGTVDYHELMSRANWAGYQVWHHVLNNGFKVPAVGGEDSISDLHRTAIIGQDRVYAHLGERLSWEKWLDAIRSGRSFVTNGPLLDLQVERKMPGEELHLPPKGGRIRVRGRVRSIVPLEHAELVIQGKPLALDAGSLRHLSESGAQLEFERELEIRQSSWITLQVYGSGARHPIDDGFPQATTNPVWVYVGDEPIRSSESADYFIRWIEKLTAMAEADPGWRSEKEKAHVLGQFQEGAQVYRRLKEEAMALGR